MIMKIEKITDGSFVIRANVDELLILNNTLNEVCNGLPLKDFETRIGAPLLAVELLLKEVSEALDRSTAH
jgi:hypothetical protein